MYPQGCGGSSPFFGTSPFSSKRLLSAEVASFSWIGTSFHLVKQRMPSASTTTAVDTRRLSLTALIIVIVGSMVGAGIFSLPRTFGDAACPFGALIAITTWI